MNTAETGEILMKVNNNVFASFMRLIMQTGVVALNNERSPIADYEKEGLEYLGINIYGTDIHLYTKI